MTMPLLVVFCLTSVTVIVHAFGTLEALVYLSRAWMRKANPGVIASLIQVLRVVSVLLLLHWIEALIWAGFYFASGAMPDLETSMYFSLTSYTTLGYGYVVLPMKWRLLGPFEGAVGILMFGWSTGIMVAAITRIYGRHFRNLNESPISSNGH